MIKYLIKKFSNIKLIFTLRCFKYINIFLSDLFLCYFIILGIRNFNKDNNIIILCISIGIITWLLQFLKYIKIPFNYWNVNKLSSSLLNVIALYGFIINFEINKDTTMLLINLYLINYGIGKIISFFLDKEMFSLDKKETLFHELGHFFICKEYGILNPELIDMNTKGDVNGSLVVNGNIESIQPLKFVTILLAGYVAEKYIVHNKEDFTLRELRNVLLIEYENKTYSDDYLQSLILIYLDDNILKETVINIIDIINENKENIFTVAKENKYKKIINLKKYV